MFDKFDKRLRGNLLPAFPWYDLLVIDISIFSNLVFSSPNGLQFESCKEVSAYLLSLFGPQNESQQRSTRIDKSSSLPTRSVSQLFS